MSEYARTHLRIKQKCRLNPPGWFVLAGMLVLLGVSFSTSAGQMVQLVPSKDNTLYENAAGEFSNGAGVYLYAGQTGTRGSEKLRRAVLEFSLASIPPGSVVESAKVELTVNKKPDSGATTDLAHLHRLLAEWGEGTSDAGSPGGAGEASSAGDASWIHTFYPSTLWTTAGGDYDLTASATVPFGNFVPETLKFQSASMINDVQGWIDDPASNHGWILLADENTPKNARRFYSRESVNTNPGDIPLLTVEFTPPSVTDHLSLVPVVSSGLTGPPIGIANAGDGSGRIFIIEQQGVIRIYDTNSKTLLSTPFLDITSRVGIATGERGLLGLAFHPDYFNNGRFFVYYTFGDDPGNSRVASYQVSGGNPDVAGTAESVLMEFPQDSTNHNGGDMHFGTDGYLYIATGDGGGGGDTYKNAQNLFSLKGKMLRIDVDGTPAGGAELCGSSPNYGIPPGNAFPGNGNGCDEILYLGLRNPWRFSFDAQTQDMYIGDVGQGLWEEVDFAAPGSSGLNFGWPCWEGNHAYTPPVGVTCPANPVFPIIEYSSGPGTSERSITGGYVYRGASTPLSGRYVYGDYWSDRIWIARRDGDSWISEEWVSAAAVLDSITAFGQDEKCELYVADASAGKIYRIVDTEMVLQSGFEARVCR